MHTPQDTESGAFCFLATQHDNASRRPASPPPSQLSPTTHHHPNYPPPHSNKNTTTTNTQTKQATKKAAPSLPQGLLRAMVALHDVLFMLAGVDGEALQAGIAKVIIEKIGGRKGGGAC